jgi:hypothetical protein
MNEQLKFIKTSGKITHHSRWIYGVYTSDDWRKSERYQHVNGWIRKHEDLNQLSQEISPDTAMEAEDSDKANVVDFRAPNMFQNIPLLFSVCYREVKVFFMPVLHLLFLLVWIII